MVGGLPHDQRIPKAREWVSSYTGDSLIKTYQKRMSVDRMTAIRDLGELGALSEDRVVQLFESERKRTENIARQRATAANNRMISEIAALPPEIREKLAEHDGRVYHCEGSKAIPWEDYRQTLIADGILVVKPTKAERQAAKMAKKAAKKPNKPHRRVCPNCGRKMTQQFIGLKHCKCGMSWSKQDGYFERSPDMVFCLEKQWVGKKRKNVPVIKRECGGADEQGTGDSMQLKVSGCFPRALSR